MRVGEKNGEPYSISEKVMDRTLLQLSTERYQSKGNNTYEKLFFFQRESERAA